MLYTVSDIDLDYAPGDEAGLFCGFRQNCVACRKRRRWLSNRASWTGCSKNYDRCFSRPSHARYRSSPPQIFW